MIDIEDVKRLTMGPEDILVMQVKGHITTETADRIKRSVSDGYPSLKNKIMVLDDSMSLAVLVAEETKLRA